MPTSPRSESDLRSTLLRLDGKSYPAYKDLRGAFDLGDCTIFVDHVQGDPFAAPSRMRVRVPMDEAQWPVALRDTRVRRTALADLLARRVRDAIGRGTGRGTGQRGSGKSGVVRVDAGGQEVLERSAVVLADDWVEVRLDVGLPAAGRRILGREAERLLLEDVPEIAHRGLVATPRDAAGVEDFVACVENQEHLRAQLAEHSLVAFVADGAILPRESGASDRPLRGEAVVPFAAPESLRVSLELARPRAGRDRVTGLGIPRGVTLITGGGYHGKSTLLRAIERGVHPHIPGDGREEVASDAGLVKIRAEDGRRVERVDIAGFIRDLPGGRSTRAFSSDDASGSTSQAASIVEALEAGATGLLLDEDTSASNFMVRDARMQALVAAEHEPITPFLDRVRELYDTLGVSSVLVMGGCGDYFDVADTVLRLRDYRADDATHEARAIARDHPTSRQRETPEPLRPTTPRIPLATSIDASRGRREAKISAPTRDTLRFGREDIDLRGLEQLLDASQTRAIGFALHLAAQEWMDGKTPLPAVLDAIEHRLDEAGLDALSPSSNRGEHPGHLARPRRHEIAAALNRLRTLRIQHD